MAFSHYIFSNFNLLFLGVSLYIVSYILKLLANLSFFLEKVFKVFGVLLIFTSVF
jgi:hypothetical protein